VGASEVVLLARLVVGILVLMLILTLMMDDGDVRCLFLGVPLVAAG
jgi:hypothetical protein